MKIGLPLANLAARLALIQLAAYKHFVVENPWASHLWLLPSWQSVLRDTRTCFTYLDQCQYGLKDMNNQFTQKPTCFVASHKLLVEHLRRICKHTHVHSPLAGSIGGISKCKFAQVWPIALCEAIMQGIITLKRHLRQQTSLAFPAETLCPGCRQHAHRGDSRHNRGPACRFPFDTADVWTCPSCVKNQHVHNIGHTRIPGECRWATASVRAISSLSLIHI